MNETQLVDWRNICARASDRLEHLQYKIADAEREIKAATSENHKLFVASQRRGYLQEAAEIDAIMAADAIVIASIRSTLLESVKP